MMTRGSKQTTQKGISTKNNNDNRRARERMCKVMKIN
jgi:hypothetical protein